MVLVALLLLTPAFRLGFVMDILKSVRSVFRVFSVFRGFTSCSLCQRIVNAVIITTEHTEHTEDVWSDSMELSVFQLCRSYGTHSVSLRVFYQYFVPDGTLQRIQLLCV
ncbi:MAG: hypothetical protein HW390_3502 [Candidatus Brocadiaceae bacterium]|nr:hypothetical protein [Candidatus Brocadiaceae bacterium]